METEAATSAPEHHLTVKGKPKAIRCMEFRSISAKFDRTTGPRKGALSCVLTRHHVLVRGLWRVRLLGSSYIPGVISPHAQPFVSYWTRFIFSAHNSARLRSEWPTPRNSESARAVPDFGATAVTGTPDRLPHRSPHARVSQDTRSSAELRLGHRPGGKPAGCAPAPGSQPQRQGPDRGSRGCGEAGPTWCSAAPQ